ncbi:hypothetical protein EDB92DRAFT_1804662 [Lactarius akahatsu]|uniref:Uncharacterized protein n=1 Tax=Lactarius akahatsu TaxID=416441 RepID=A0AAD4L898_9AGAM|nr:hypothetical protein EDB92DRAFT_1804662 [Lactarius akahatsu]
MSPSFKSEGRILFFFFSNCLPWSLPGSPHSRFANHSAHFITAYGEGLLGAQAAWANKKYHSHCTLPPPPPNVY